MEGADEVEPESAVMLLNGHWCSVGSTKPSFACRHSPENFHGSTGACCIVRTVLNFQAVPRDKTCKHSIFFRGQTHIADSKISWWCRPLDMEIVSGTLCFLQ